MNPTKNVLPLIVLSQFLCTSLWFAGNAIINELVINFDLGDHTLAYLTSAVQLGFITGTLLFAILTIADRFSPSKVFFFCALSGALFNLLTLLPSNTLFSLLSWRIMVGFTLAGVYPVGMKIAADHFDTGLGRSLGYLVGALVLGTAFPHLIRWVTGGNQLPWQWVVYTTSFLALCGGFLILIFVADGPYMRKRLRFEWSAFTRVFSKKPFRAAAFGYFGHMWELYAFWAFVPVMLEVRNNMFETELPVSAWSFAIIAIGSLGCVAGGYLSERFGLQRIAGAALLVSGLCCLASPLFVQTASPYFFLGFMLIWGMAVITDSPLFSTLVAKNAEPDIKGTALTLVNCIGFSLTIISIQLLGYLTPLVDRSYLMCFLLPGPVFGLWRLFKVTERKS
ncbi:MFS transporter [Robertkochia aurantiaca]|uniref:MFS transporter n=1 Tax=Robertkochia aurantiaca TaxID=2873700 RepID=UPI001CCAB5D7|nr:MFS transporter [Robertkochia sp. 3YJGBD-33]